MSRSDYDKLYRPTLFCFDSPQNFNCTTVLDFCVANGFRHVMLWEGLWGRCGAYESLLGGHKYLKWFIAEAHDKDIIVTLHGRNVDASNAGVLAAHPLAESIIRWNGKFCIDPESALQDKVSYRWVDVANMVNADGLYLDGCGIAWTYYHNDIDEYRRLVALQHTSLIKTLDRPMILQCANDLSYDDVPDPHQKEWCLSGQRDHYINAVRGCGYTGSRDDWNSVHIRRCQSAIDLGYYGQIGWLDFKHDQIHNGEPLEDQSVASMTRLCTAAKDLHVPIVIEATMEEIESHPESEEILKVVRWLTKGESL